MSVLIRPFTPADYEGYARALGAAYEDPTTADSVRDQDNMFDPKVKRQRWVAELEGKIVGIGEYYQRIGAYHPRKFDMSLGVHPEYRGQGIGKVLFEELLQGLAQHDPLTLSCQTQEDWDATTGFLARRGFVEAMRTWESHLDLDSVDLTSFEPVLERAEEQGYRITTLREFSGRPGWEQQLFSLITDLRMDVPSDEPRTLFPFDSWLRGLSHRLCWWDGYLIAEKDGELAASTALWRTDVEGELTNGLTGVRKAYRGTGIAQALKVRGIQIARGAGYKKIKTWNESNNQRMLAINMQLGFRRMPAWVTFKLHFKTEG